MMLVAYVGLALVAGLILLLVICAVTFVVSPARGRELFGLLAMFIRSVFKARAAAQHPRRHRRSGDVDPHEHRRKTPLPADTIRFYAQPHDRTEEDQ